MESVVWRSRRFLGITALAFHAILGFMTIFTLRILLGLALALLWMRWAGERHGFTDGEAWGLGLWVAVGALSGGRLAFLFLHANYFREYPLASLALRAAPGLGGEGAWMGALLAAWLWSRREGRPSRTVLAFLAPALLLVAASGWWACAEVGCGWGAEALRIPSWQRLFVRDAPDLYHLVRPRYEVQWLKAGGLALFALVAMKPRRALPALVLALLWSAALTAWQGDPQLQWGFLRLDAALDLLLAAFLLLVQWPPKRIMYHSSRERGG